MAGDPPWPFHDYYGPSWPYYGPTMLSTPSPRIMPVAMPFPMSGCITIATLDSNGNVTIKADQPKPD